ncbi:Hsp20/alpha crystallin family protein [Neobacillus notoginsengisoli]|uniref:Hsp20/alpha crystallin family protein n=1 Tax=Neobacillus notoginsengisoli TaxID=1578198 RepID=A0A417YXH0_9BACI|nr:Hsp20/alpha crystallin family protein [Neobacillus notoginsengisoli]RHW42246.1 Hsp20/alpha crystallin family protein [Neobacillus notoginsengisoli]
MFPWGSFPFNKNMPSDLQNMKPETIEKYVKDAMEAYFPGNSFQPFQTEGNDDRATSVEEEPYQAAIFNTHDFVFVRLEVAEEHLENIRLFHTSSQLILENLPETGKKQVYNLPSVVRKKGASASVRDGILEVRLQRAIDVQLSEIVLP